ncbi:MAG: hypothetical protein HYT72_01720 [Candidatus Aenigmarchaeota archaeon]|nr:hypothetical protein [Candidatus Aenigmarchaeota archaeon]
MTFYKTEKKYIDRPWKVILWLLLIDGVVAIPLRFLRSYISLETIDVLFVLRFLTFLLAVFLTGLLYVNSVKRPVDKKLKIRVASYYALYTLVALLFLASVFGVLYTNVLGGLLEGAVSIVISFLSVYFILPLANRQKRK